MKYKTKEEKFLFALYKEKDQIQNPYEVGKTLGYSSTGVDIIVQLLAKGNFITREGEAEVSLTEHGIRWLDIYTEAT
jgi:hypothetical protein